MKTKLILLGGLSFLLFSCAENDNMKGQSLTGSDSKKNTNTIGPDTSRRYEP